MARKKKASRSRRKPSQKLDMSPEKAKKILKHGKVRGKKLTAAQKGMFGAKAGS